ncbi:MAG: cold shock domain-containing protein [Acidimicrobiia bacterium]|nr:cold shock domain-containing protein [Acidimicrobiia bacterium]
MSDGAVSGVVRAFEESRGIGVIDADGRSYPFHCTQIADGTRTVRVGTTVQFRIVPGRRGDWEAAEIEKSEA